MRLIITGYNRPEYMRQTIASWAQVRGIQDIVTEFHLEPGNPSVEWVCRRAPFPSEVHISDKHLGVRQNPRKAASHAFQCDNFVILAEDDIVVGTDTLEYFTWAEENYAGRDDVMTIAASQGEMPDPLENLGGVTVEQRFSAWVWGTWKHNWETYLEPDWDNDPRGWDYRVNLYWHHQEGFRCVIPNWSRAQHIGQYGGTHCQEAEFESLKSPCFVADLPPQEYFEL